MKDEIREILLIIKSCKQDYDKQKNGMHTFDYGELYLLFNYITNLQQENKHKDKLIDIANAGIENLQQENEKIRNRNNELYEGFKASIEELGDTCTELEDYKSRCEKAYSYVDNVPISHYEKGYMEDGILISKKVIKNILENGSDKE